MKRLAFVILIMFVILTGTAVAADNNFGIGFYGNIVGNGTGVGGGGGMTFRSGLFPVIGLEWSLMDNSSILGVSLDWWIVNKPLVSIFSYYIGLGAYVAVRDVSSSNIFTLGGRIPFGLQVFIIQPVELFLEIAPMIQFIPSIDWTVSARLGFRILF